MGFKLKLCNKIRSNDQTVNLTLYYAEKKEKLNVNKRKTIIEVLRNFERAKLKVLLVRVGTNSSLLEGIHRFF